MQPPLENTSPRPAQHSSFLVRRPCLTAVALVLVVALGSLLLHPRYHTADDIYMQFIASGRVVTDHPDEHLLFSNVAIGLALKQLYLIAPAIPWYGVYLFATLIVSFIVIVFVVLET